MGRDSSADQPLRYPMTGRFTAGSGRLTGSDPFPEAFGHHVDGVHAACGHAAAAVPTSRTNVLRSSPMRPPLLAAFAAAALRSPINRRAYAIREGARRHDL